MTDDTTKMSNQQLRAHIRVMDRRLNTAGAHLAQMGPYMQEMMAAHWQIVEIAHKRLDAIRLHLSIGVRQTIQMRKALNVIADISAKFAADYKQMTTPEFSGDKLVEMAVKAADAEPDMKPDYDATKGGKLITKEQSQITPNERN